MQLASRGAEGIVVTVADVEYLGHETLVKVRPGCTDSDVTAIAARLPGMQACNQGDTIRLQLDSSQVYLFAADGTALNRG